MIIKHKNEEYVIDIEKAIKSGAAVKKEIPFVVGGVYAGDTINNLLLVQATHPNFGEVNYCLLGMGLSPNSNEFYGSLHTKEEILDHLKGNGMNYSHCIQSEVVKLAEIKPRVNRR